MSLFLFYTLHSLFSHSKTPCHKKRAAQNILNPGHKTLQMTQQLFLFFFFSNEADSHQRPSQSITEQRTGILNSSQPQRLRPRSNYRVINHSEAYICQSCPQLAYYSPAICHIACAGFFSEEDYLKPTLISRFTNLLFISFQKNISQYSSASEYSQCLLSLVREFTNQPR